MNLRQLFDFSLVERRDEPALEFLACDGRLESRTFGDLDDASNRLARVLAERGFTAGDRLCVYLPNSVEMIELFLACVKLGVIFVPINILYREREIAHIVSDAEPKAMITALELEALAQAAAAADPEERTPFRPLDGDAAAAIVYTSGTTGASKGAVLTHNNFAANALNLITCWQITSGGPAVCFRCRCFTCTASETGCARGSSPAAVCGLLERFEHQKAAAIDAATSGRRCFLACRPSTYACWRRRRLWRARSAQGCGCLFPVPRRFPRRYSRISATGLVIPSSNATA